MGKVIWSACWVVGLVRESFFVEEMEVRSDFNFMCVSNS